MTGLSPDSVAALIDYGEKKFPDAFIKILCSLNDTEFDEALEGILEKAVDYLEKNANFYAEDKEDKITSVLVAYLSFPGLRTTQQAHSKGHVDITIESEQSPPIRRRLGEAKIYDGPKYHVDGLDQLVSRYMTGREGFGILIEYVKKPGIKNLVEKLKEFMDKNKPCIQDGIAQDHFIRWAFYTKHQHNSGEIIRVVHLNCNLYQDKNISG